MPVPEALSMHRPGAQSHLQCCKGAPAFHHATGSNGWVRARACMRCASAGGKVRSACACMCAMRASSAFTVTLCPCSCGSG